VPNVTNAKRHQRQMRLPLVGREGQKVLSGIAAVVGATGDEGRVAARYLAGAGVGRITVRDPDVAAAGQRVDASVTIVVAPVAEPAPMQELDELDPAARAVARGARAAAQVLVAALRAPRPEVKGG
jgi:hypothetical protein